MLVIGSNAGETESLTGAAGCFWSPVSPLPLQPHPTDSSFLVTVKGRLPWALSVHEILGPEGPLQQGGIAVRNVGLEAGVLRNTYVFLLKFCVHFLKI